MPRKRVAPPAPASAHHALALLPLDELVAKLVESETAFCLVHFPDPPTPDKRFSAFCPTKDEAKFFASDANAAILGAVAHYRREEEKNRAEAERLMAKMIARSDKQRANLAGLEAHVHKPEGQCDDCGKVHKGTDFATAMHEIISGLTGAKKAKPEPEGGGN